MKIVANLNLTLDVSGSKDNTLNTRPTISDVGGARGYRGYDSVDVVVAPYSERF